MIELSPLRKAIKCLDDSLKIVHNPEFISNLDLAVKDLLKAGVIQNFKVTYELCWKFMKRYLEINIGSQYIDGIHRKELYRLAAEHHLIKEVEAWFDYNKARNLTSHTYREEYANDVFQSAEKFLTDAGFLLSALEARND
ncbi:MAG: nucleotidyltransferase substrate binding protein [Candidatus Eremiobacteraeota bacterium]|nr:nucleotidyltransferase substrate binding protein [Candidatus Eremiobacteraeota bacterium]